MRVHVLVGPTWLSAVLCRYTQAIPGHASSHTERSLVMLVMPSTQAVNPPEKWDKLVRKACLSYPELLQYLYVLLLCVNTL